MRRRPHRLLLAGVLASIAVLASGCELTGSIDLSNPALAKVDLTLATEGLDCNESGISEIAPDLVVVEARGDSATATCQVVGTADPVKFFAYIPGSTFVNTATGHLLVFNFDAYGRADPQIDLTITMPGPIWRSNGGEVSGSRVQLSNAAGLDQGVLIVESVDPAKLWIPVAGLGVVLALIAGAFWLGLRRGHGGGRGATQAAALEDPEAELDSPTTTLEAPAASATPETRLPMAAQPEPDNSVWAPPVD